MTDRLKWAGATVPLLVAIGLGALAYDAEDSTASAIGYGFGVGLMAVVVTALGRFIYIRTPAHRGEPLWTPDVLALAGVIGILMVAAIALGDTQG